MTTIEKLEEVKRLLGEVVVECNTTGEVIWPATIDEDWTGRELLYVAKHIKTNILAHDGQLNHYIKTLRKHS